MAAKNHTTPLRRSPGAGGFSGDYCKLRPTRSVPRIAVTRNSCDLNCLSHYVYVYTDDRRKPAKTFWTTSSRGTLFATTRSRKRWVGYEDDSLEYGLLLSAADSILQDAVGDVMLMTCDPTNLQAMLANQFSVSYCHAMP
jgi:hypothetical protein